MCGFTSILSESPLSARHIDTLRSQSQLIEHRGPDSQSEIILENYCSFLTDLLYVTQAKTLNNLYIQNAVDI